MFHWLICFCLLPGSLDLASNDRFETNEGAGPATAPNNRKSLDREVDCNQMYSLWPSFSNLKGKRSYISSWIGTFHPDCLGFTPPLPMLFHPLYLLNLLSKLSNWDDWTEQISSGCCWIPNGSTFKSQLVEVDNWQLHLFVLQNTWVFATNPWC